MGLESRTDSELRNLEGRALRAIADGTRLLRQIRRHMSRPTSNGEPSARMPIGSTCESTCVNVDRKESRHEKKEARSKVRVEERSSPKRHRQSRSEESSEAVERVDGSVDPPQRRGRGSEGKSQGERTKEWKKRNPDKWRAYMRVYMRKKRHKVK
jgi:hypothetical protein